MIGFLDEIVLVGRVWGLTRKVNMLCKKCSRKHPCMEQVHTVWPKAEVCRQCQKGGQNVSGYQFQRVMPMLVAVEEVTGMAMV